MEREKKLYVFICEDQQLAKTLVKEHFDRHKITYAHVMSFEKRTEIVDALDKVEYGNQL